MTSKGKSNVVAVPESFEEAMQELQTIVQTMEGEVLSLEQALQSYERAVLLSQACHQKLEAAEQQVKVLQDGLLKPIAAIPAEPKAASTPKTGARSSTNAGIDEGIPF